MEEKLTGKKCLCGGEIIERSHIPYIPAVSENLVGDGSKNIATEKNRKINGYHCENCGCEYNKLPEN